MAIVHSFLDLRTWKEAHQLVLEVYRITSDFPKSEGYGLISQLRRAAMSIPSNIAEGMGRATTKDLIRFLVQSRGSAQEVLYQLLLSKDLGYIESEQYKNLADRYNGLSAGINGHIASLSRRPLNH